MIIFEGHSEAFANGDVISQLYSERKEGGLEAAGQQHLYTVQHGDWKGFFCYIRSTMLLLLLQVFAKGDSNSN